MLTEALKYFISVDLPSGYEPLQYVCEVVILLFLISEFYKFLRMVINR